MRNGKREIHTHESNVLNDNISIDVMDDPGPGGANHVYHVTLHYGEDPIVINFQKGGIQEAGINGLTQEVLLAIVIDRLECFQKGNFANEYNAEALEHTKKALEALKARTADRVQRGVEGLQKQ